MVDSLEKAVDSSKHLENQNHNLYEGILITKNVLDKIF